MIQDKIDRSHDDSWKKVRDKKDHVDSTHSIIEVDNLDLFNIAIEVSDEQAFEIAKLMRKEVDAANRFWLTDGYIQGEFEIWDGDFTKRLYFCVDFTLKQAIRLAKQQRPAIGFVPVRFPKLLLNKVILGGQEVFAIDDLWQIIKHKTKYDSMRIKPTHSWKVG